MESTFQILLIEIADRVTYMQWLWVLVSGSRVLQSRIKFWKCHIMTKYLRSFMSFHRDMIIVLF